MNVLRTIWQIIQIPFMVIYWVIWYLLFRLQLVIRKLIYKLKK